MAAIYLDGGLEAARDFFDSAWAGALDEVIVLPRAIQNPRCRNGREDRGLGLPAYDLV